MLIDISLSKLLVAHCLPCLQCLGSSDSFPYASPQRVGRNKQPYYYFSIIENLLKRQFIESINTCDL